MQNQEGADYFLLSQTNDPSLEYEYLKAYANWKLSTEFVRLIVLSWSFFSDNEPEN